MLAELAQDAARRRRAVLAEARPQRERAAALDPRLGRRARVVPCVEREGRVSCRGRERGGREEGDAHLIVVTTRSAVGGSKSGRPANVRICERRYEVRVRAERRRDREREGRRDAPPKRREPSRRARSSRTACCEDEESVREEERHADRGRRTHSKRCRTSRALSCSALASTRRTATGSVSALSRTQALARAARSPPYLPAHTLACERNSPHENWSAAWNERAVAMTWSEVTLTDDACHAEPMRSRSS